MFLPLTETDDYLDILSLEDDMLERVQYLYEMGKLIIQLTLMILIMVKQ